MPNNSGYANATTTERAEAYEELMPLLESMYREFQELSKKKPDAVLNKRKVEIVNRLLRDVYHVLEGQTSSAYLDLLDEDDLPQNSDVVLMLSQTVAAMRQFKSTYYGWDSEAATHCWSTVD